MGYNAVADDTGHSFSCCCVPNLQNPVKLSKNSKLWVLQFKIIDPGVNWKRICNFLLINNSNFGVWAYLYSFRDIDAFSFKIACFPTHPSLTPPSGGTPCNINIIYTLLKSTFSGLQFLSQTLRVYFHFYSFSRYCLPKSRNHAKFRKNYLIAVRGHRRSSILVSIESSYVTSY